MTGRPWPTSGIPAVFVSADWSVEQSKRAVWIADVEARSVRPVIRPAWTLHDLMETAGDFAYRGSVLVGVDAALGVSSGFWRLLDRNASTQASAGSNPSGGSDAQTFVDWLGRLDPDGPFFDPANTARDPQQWAPDRPWFRVAPGKGGLTAFTEHTDDKLLRRIDQATGGNPLFAVSGIPGTVGSGTRSLWQETTRLLRRGCDFAMWPFHGELSTLLASRRIVLAETYPRLAYGAALADALPTHLQKVSKTRPDARARAVHDLRCSPWVQANRVDLGDSKRPFENEDDFDAYITAAAVLRCAITEVPLHDPDQVDPKAEGSMLLTGAVDLRRRPPRRKQVARRTDLENRERPRAASARDYRCPIPGCAHVFRGSRGGWDAHVASLRRHPGWRPDVRDPVERKRRFKNEHPDWFL